MTPFRAGICCAALFLLGSTVWADDHSPAPVVFHIEARSLKSALTQFGEQSGLQILFSKETVEGLSAPGVTGTLTPEAALQQLIAHTGLRYEFVNPHTVRIWTPTNSNNESISHGGNTGSGAVLAQTATGPTAPEASAAITAESEKAKTKLDEIVVTGTHIRGQEPASPVITIDRDYIERSGFQTAGEIVRSLPQSFSGGLNTGVVGAAGFQNVNGGTSSSSANLRGLGSESTLTLVDGHRLAYAEDISAVDISMIPLQAIERVEVVTDGASAIYGADAVGGVVNFILRKDFQGIAADGSWGTATDGGGMQQRYSLMGGERWGGGNAMLSYEFAHQTHVTSDDRSYVSPSLTGTTLVPATRRHSFFLDANQSIGSQFDLGFEGLYTRRTATSSQNTGGGYVETPHATIDQYSAAVTANVRLPGSWHAALSGDVSGSSAAAPVVETFNGVDDQSGIGGLFHSRIRSIELTADGDLFTLPSGIAKLALGAGAREETFSLGYTPSLPFLIPVDAKRNVRYAYVESTFPLVPESSERIGLQSLTLTLAGRAEHYSDFGSTTNPKIGLVYTPITDVKLRTSWGRSFRAPSLLEEHSPDYAVLLDLPDTGSVSGSTESILRSGGNEDLKPERSTSYTIDLEVNPSEWPGAKFRLGYFDIRYRSKLNQPFGDTNTALADPSVASFVARDPTLQVVSAIIAQSIFINATGRPFDPAAVAAIVDNRYQNVSDQAASGVDAIASYRLATPLGQFDWSANIAYIDLRQRLTESSPYQDLAGTVFNTPRVKARGGVSWTRDGWTASGFVNYSGSSRDPFSDPPQEVASWTTIDAQVGYIFQTPGALRDAKIALSSQNLLNRRPPFVNASQSGLPGLNYDSTNASALGRFVSLELSKQF